MACDPNTLLAEATCFNCNISGAMFDAVEIVLLCAINDGDAMACDPQTLITQASCLLTCIPPGMMPAIKLSLLCQILAAGGGGAGASQIVAYTTTDPNTDGVVPPDLTKPAIAVKPFATTYVWTTPAGPWDV